MKKDTQKQQNTNGAEKLFGTLTPAKTSGISYSLASIVPVLLTLVFIVVISAVGLTNDENYSTQNWYRYANYLLPQVSFALVVFFWLRLTQKPVKTVLTEQKCAPKYFLIALVLQIGLFSLSELNTLFLKLLGNLGYEDMGINLPDMNGFGFVGVLIVVAVLPALLEEIVFRGVLLNGLRSFGMAGAVLICGGLFALYHQNPAQTIYQFCCGVAFALVAIRAGSVLPTVLSHFVNNALILLLTKLGIENFPTPVFVGIIIVSVLCLIASLVYLIFWDKNTEQKREDSSKEERKTFLLCSLLGMVVCAINWLTVLYTGIAG